MVAAADSWREAGTREVSAADAPIRRARNRNVQGLGLVDVEKIIGASRAAVPRYPSTGSNEVLAP